jgi:hypothetical protein
MAMGMLVVPRERLLTNAGIPVKTEPIVTPAAMARMIQAVR